VESVGAAGDEPDFVVECFGAALVDPEPDRLEDPVAVAADRAGEGDERGQAIAGRLGDEPVDQERGAGVDWSNGPLVEAASVCRASAGPSQCTAGELPFNGR
jgi:hypothetical protein